MRKTFIILAVIIALALVLMMGCQQKIIGGDKDSQGCLIGAGYSWDENVTACTRSWELDESQKEAAKIAVAPISARPITVIEVIKARCPGCFAVKLQTGEGAPYTITLENWTVIENKECADSCPLLSQPAPSFCTDGTIVDQGKDDCGCQLPPKCLRACTEEAKICPDGSAVGRNSENDCEFDPCPNVGIPNPASAFCISQGGESKIVTAADGSQSGTCTLPYRIMCDEWAYFRGECPAKVSCTDEQKAAEICTMEYAPVCGNDGVTYGNKCSGCASKKIDYYTQGECPERTYVTQDPEQCKVIRYICVEGKVPFSDDYGCGCEPETVCGDCPKYEPIFCSNNTKMVAGDVDECGCAGPPRCDNPLEGKLKATDCTEPRAQACTKEYVPVCGWFNQSIQCIKYPCAANYGNKCTACADGKVAYWTEGQCPNDPVKAI